MPSWEVHCELRGTWGYVGVYVPEVNMQRILGSVAMRGPKVTGTEGIVWRQTRHT